MSEPSENPDRQFQLDVLGLLSSLQAGQSSLQADLSELRSSVGASIRQIVADQVELRDSVRQVAADQIKLRVEVMARIDRLQATVDLVREDARVNWATG